MRGAAKPSAEGVTDAVEKEADPLVIRHLDFLGPQLTKDGWRPENALPEVAFAGRSNVGKSSLLNTLLRRKALARVSNTPGRTRQINFFSVNKTFVLADLPGYGYAKISKQRKAEWRPLIEGYLRSSKLLAGVVLLLDVRHDPSPDDAQMLDFLAKVGVPTIVVVTKTDKLGAVALAERVQSLTALLGLDPEQLVTFSSRTGEGRNTLAIALNDLLEQPAWRPVEISDVVDPDEDADADIRSAADVGANVGADVGANVGADVGANVGADVGADAHGSTEFRGDPTLLHQARGAARSDDASSVSPSSEE